MNTPTVLEGRVRRLESELGGLREGVICGLGTLLDLRDLDTGTHATRLAEWAKRVGEWLGLDDDELRDVEIASLLHDIGKVGIPDEVLNKSGRLTDEEYELIKKHPDFGWAVLRLLPGFENASLLVLHHHERPDGRGYPGGLVGEQIPLGSRIVAVVDAFDAMVSDRAYRKGLSPQEALQRLHEGSGTQFDARIVELFTKLAGSELEGIASISEPTRRVVA